MRAPSDSLSAAGIPTMTQTVRPGLLARLREDVLAVRARDPAARSAFEVLATYPGLHALILHRIANGLWRRQWRFTARLLAGLARGLTQIDIHPAATIGRRMFIDHGCGVVIGETAEIGDDVTLYQGVTLGGTSLSRGKRHPTLGDGVTVGAGAKVLGAIEIGAGARVGANSVVIRDVPAAATVVGIPGRVVPRSDTARADGIDLDHHLMPDPVGRALACLIQRIDDLEARLAAAGPAIPGLDHPHACTDCGDACDQARHAAAAHPAALHS